MKKILALVIAGLAMNFATAQSNKVIKLSKKVDVFWYSKPGDVKSITVLGETILTSEMNFNFAKRGIRSLSSKAAENRLLQIRERIEGGENVTDVLGSKKLVNSDIILEVQSNEDFLQGDIYEKVNVTIIDLSKDGEIIGGARWGRGARQAHVIGEAIVIALLKEINGQK